MTPPPKLTQWTTSRHGRCYVCARSPIASARRAGGELVAICAECAQQAVIALGIEREAVT